MHECVHVHSCTSVCAQAGTCVQVCVVGMSLSMCVCVHMYNVPVRVCILVFVCACTRACGDEKTCEGLRPQGKAGSAAVRDQGAFRQSSPAPTSRHVA